MDTVSASAPRPQRRYVFRGHLEQARVADDAAAARETAVHPVIAPAEAGAGAAPADAAAAAAKSRRRTRSLTAYF